MKKTLFTLMAMLGIASADTVPFVVTFGTNSGQSVTTPSVTLNSWSGVYNKISTKSDGGCTVDKNSLKMTDGSTSSYGVSVATAVSGGNGMINSMSNGENGVVSDYFTVDILGAVVNGANGSTSVTLSNLSTGTYSLFVLGGRGNLYGNKETTVYSVTGANVNVTGVDILDYAVSAQTIDAPTITANNTVTATTYNPNGTKNATNWVLMRYDLLVSADNSSLTVTGNGSAGNIAGLILAPEPATATLSLLALAGMALRRRRR